MSQLYFLKNKKTGLFWDGSYHRYDNEWNKRPRFFRNAAALYNSLNSPIPKCWKEEYIKNNPDFPEHPAYPHNRFKTIEESKEYYRLSDIYYQHSAVRRKEWKEYIKQNKLKSVDILKMMESNGYICYTIKDGQAIRNAKAL